MHNLAYHKRQSKNSVRRHFSLVRLAKIQTLGTHHIAGAVVENTMMAGQGRPRPATHMCISLSAHVSASTNEPPDTLAKQRLTHVDAALPAIAQADNSPPHTTPRVCGWLNIGPQTCPGSNLWDLWTCHLTWHEGLCRCDRVKVSEMRDYRRACRRAGCHHEGPYKGKKEAGGSESEKEAGAEGCRAMGQEIKTCRLL